MITQAYRNLCKIALMVVMGGYSIAWAQVKVDQPQFFGLNIATASKTQVVQALTQQNFAKIRESYYQCQSYQVNKKLLDADLLRVCYTQAGKLALAEYRIPAFMNAQKVVDIANIVEDKYGKPSEIEGNAALGNFSAKWQFAKGNQLLVSRGWPDTTVYLDLYHLKNYRQYERERQAAQQAEVKSRSEKDAKGF
ncbi:MAG: hypothetical protein GY821_09615 [Gammaproteobacteria bacterium]|nr:hypothetical protein [Gammaproteobacteria bacterium]